MTDRDCDVRVIWIVLEGERYEGEQNMAVFSSSDDAEAFREDQEKKWKTKNPRRQPGLHYFRIEEHIIDDVSCFDVSEGRLTKKASVKEND